MKPVYLIVGVAAVVALAYFFKADLPLNFDKLAVDLQEIKTGDENNPDMVSFTDGAVLNDAGFDVEHVGTLVLPAAKPVFLFKSFTCRQCEPEVNLVIYTSENREVTKLPFPGIHTLIGVEDDDEDSEIDDQVVEGVFGKCGGPAHVILLARKNREVESDGMTARPGENWSFTSTTVEFSAAGAALIKNDDADGFGRVQSLISEECLSIEPQDSHDYL